MRGISPKPITRANVAEAMNKEIVPLLRELRTALLRLEAAGDTVAPHAATHTAGQPDQLYADLLPVAYPPTNYIAALDMLLGHLAGIDEALSPYLVYVAEPLATHAFVLEDRFKTINSTGAVAATFTLPLNATIAYPIGTVIRFLWSGAGQPTIAVAGGGTLLAPSGAKVAAVNKFAFAEKTAIDTWLLSGSLVV